MLDYIDTILTCSENHQYNKNKKNCEKIGYSAHTNKSLICIQNPPMHEMK